MSRNGRAFALISLFVICSDGLFIGLNYRSAQQALENSLHDELTESQASFQLKLEATAQSMQQISAFVASDDRVRDIFRRGREAVLAEGGGPGGPQAAKIRQELLNLVGPGWKRVGKEFSVRQLHFHLGPGSLSFLRVHKPQKFGDRMDDVRYTIVAANELHIPTKGFETGRVYSGIRGVTPVSAINPQTQESEHIGAVEAGFAFPDMLASLKSLSGANYAVLLHKAHFERNVWPEFAQKMYKKRPPIGDFYIEAAINEKSTRALLQQLPDQNQLSAKHIKRVKLHDKTFAVTSFPLRDYLGSKDPLVEDAGRVLVWIDASEQQAAFEKTILYNITLSIVAFFLLEVILYFVIRWVTFKLQAVIDQRTSLLADANHALAKTNKELANSLKQLKETESQLVHSEKMASIGQFAAGIAHEINNPIGYLKANLRSFQGYWKTLFDLITPETLNAKGQDQLAFMREDTQALLTESKQGLEHIQSIVKDLKDFTRLDREQWTNVDLNEGIETTLRIAQNQIPSEINLEKSLAELPLVPCLAHQINQVFLNLLLNAIQAIQGSGKITLRTKMAENQVLVEISDSGCGISEENLKHIFEPFYTTKAVGSGTGLGLSISYGIIKRHNGRIEVESELGKGSTFRLYLPTKQ